MASASDQGDKGKTDTGAPRRGFARRWLRRLWMLAILLAVGVLLAPTLISHSNLRDKVLALAMPGGGWQARTTGGSFSWTGSQELTGLVVTDPTGETFFQAENLSVERSLASLATDRSSLGTLRIGRPTVRLKTHPGGSNLGDFLAGYQTNNEEEPDAAEANATPEVQLVVTEGLVSTEDAADPARSWSFDALSLEVSLSGDGGPVVDGSAEIYRGVVSGGGAPAGQPAGRVRFRLQADEDGGQRIDLVGENIPLPAIEPLVAGYLPGARIDGVASIDGHAVIAQDGGAMKVQTSGRMNARELGVTCDALGGEFVSATRVDLPWDATFDGGTVELRQAELDAGWVQANAAGVFTLASLSSQPAEALRGTRLAVAGEIDLPTLARQLPRTLSIKQGVEVRGGKLNFKLDPDELGGPAWIVSADLADVAGTSGGREVVWRDPIGLIAQVVPDAAGLQLQRLNLTAPFAEVAMVAGADSASAEFELSLDRLASQVSQLVDLGELSISGTASGSLRVQKTGQNGFEGNASVEARGIAVSNGTQSLLSEPQLEITALASGQHEGLWPTSLSAASVTLQGQDDELSASLTRPAQLGGDGVSVGVKLTAAGPIPSWVQRLRPWLGDAADGIAGGADVAVEVDYLPTMIQARNTRISLTNLDATRAGWGVREPKVDLTGDLRVDPATWGVASDELTFVCSTVALRAANVAVAAGGEGPTQASGTIAYRANLERLAAVFATPGESGTRPRGEAVGRVKFSSRGSEVAADFSTTAKPLQLVSYDTQQLRDKISWNEPQLDITGRASYDPARDSAQLSQLNIAGQTLRLAADVRVDQLSGAKQVEARGQLDYDPAQLASLVASYAGPGVRIEGDRRVTFAASGSLGGGGGTPAQTVHWSRTLQVQSDAGWNRGALYGMQVGAGRVQARLANGRVDFTPLEFTVGQGRLSLQPSATLDPGPQELVLPASQVVSNLAITPEVSDSILKYAAPVLAGATRADGLFSLQIDGARVPLADPKMARAAGRLDVQRATLSPGPMIEQLAAIVQQIEAVSERKGLLRAVTPSSNPLLSITDKQIPFQVADGRVHHRGLEFVVDDVPVTSSGSVGFDQTLAITLEVPIQQKWLGKEKALQGLAGQVIRLPVSGTFKKPRIDERAVANFTQQLLETAASSIIGDEINKQLDRLFGPR